MKKRYIIIVAAVFLLILSAGAAAAGTFDKNKNEPWEEYPIAHAMGGIDGYTYTNSLEAFEQNYALGQRVFEVDMQLTADDCLVCAHDWEYSSEWAEHVPTAEEFLGTKIDGWYTALSIYDLLGLMRDYEDIYIVTDTKYADPEIVRKQFGMIVDAALEMGSKDVLDRIIVQIYNDAMLDAATEDYSFPQIIYTLYQVWDGSAESFGGYLDFCRDNDIRHITMWYYLATPEIISMADSCGIHILVHTVNDPEEARALISSGVENIYTDYITPGELDD